MINNLKGYALFHNGEANLQPEGSAELQLALGQCDGIHYELYTLLVVAFLSPKRYLNKVMFFICKPQE